MILFIDDDVNNAINVINTNNADNANNAKVNDDRSRKNKNHVSTLVSIESSNS
jgi:hypothetical protein